jgi:hypothetical protein
MRVDVSGHSFVFPNECACCGATPDRELTVSANRSWGSKVVRTETKSWDVPYCTGCIEHVRADEAAGSFARWSTVLSVLLGLLVGYGLDPYWGAVVGILGVIGTVLVFGKLLRNARAKGSTNCVSLHRAVEYLGWSATLHKFEFTSRDFACNFMRANQKKLVNLSFEARNLLSVNGSGFKPSGARSPRRYIS